MCFLILLKILNSNHNKLIIVPYQFCTWMHIIFIPNGFVDRSYFYLSIRGRFSYSLFWCCNYLSWTYLHSEILCVPMCNAMNFISLFVLNRSFFLNGFVDAFVYLQLNLNVSLFWNLLCAMEQITYSCLLYRSFLWMVSWLHLLVFCMPATFSLNRLIYRSRLGEYLIVNYLFLYVT